MKKTIIIISLIIIIGGSGAFIYVKKNKNNKPEYETESAQIMNIYQTVKETGKVESYKKIDLSFERSGKLKNKFVSVGDVVKKGDNLAELDNDSLFLQKKEKQASLGVAKANLEKLQKGANESEIDVVASQEKQSLENYLSAQKNLEKIRQTVANNTKQAEEHLNDLQDDSEETQTSYEQAIITAEQNLENTKKTYGQVVNEKKDLSIVNIQTSLPKINTALDKIDSIINDDDLLDTGLLSAKDTIYLSKTNNDYNKGIQMFAEMNTTLLDNNIDALDKVIDAISLANKTSNALNYCYKVLENTITSSKLTSDKLSTLKTTISAQITTVTAIISSLNASKNSINSAIISYNTNIASMENNLSTAKISLNDAIKVAKNSFDSAKVTGEQSLVSAKNTVETTKQAWKVAENQLKNIKTAARIEDIKSAQLEIARIESSLALIDDQISNSIIKSPINGKVTAVNYEIDEQVMANSVVISIVDENHLKIEVYISEADIAKVNVGNIVDITLDAFGDEKIFHGNVKSIDPAETVLQDVVYYQVDIEFSNNEKLNIKPGMTANITIKTNQKNNILGIPNRAIIETNQKKIVRVLKNNTVIEKDVETGMNGDSGFIEILKGLKKNDIVITYIKE